LSLASIIKEINKRSKSHLIGRLPEFRKRAKGLSRIPARNIFSLQTTFERYAFHTGGRKELQFNVGYEGQGRQRRLRHGVAFSFKRGQTLPDPAILLPRVRRFNKFLASNPKAFSDLKMWQWGKDKERSKNKSPAPIELSGKLLVRDSVFIFLGRLQPADKIDYELILSDFDRLLPLYEFVERNSVSVDDQDSFETVGGFKFEPRDIDKITHTTATIIGKRLKVDLHENRLQSALRDCLGSIYGSKNVSPEQLISTMRGYLYRADIMLRRRGNEYWLYEAKAASTARHCIRQALGQLLEYSFWPGHQEATRLIVVGEAPLNREASQYLSRLRKEFLLPVEYQQFDLAKKKFVQPKT
jgi:hypothetical protein